MMEQRLGEMFVELADTLVEGFDVIDLLVTLTERCTELLAVDAAGILLADAEGHLNLAAASSEQVRLLELFQLQAEEGPCLECYAGADRVICGDLEAEQARWPAFSAVARGHGLRAVAAFPLRLRENRLGALGLFRARPGLLDPAAVAAAQALADVAAIGIVHERAFRRHEVVVEQLQGALNSRILIEQAKGILAERRRISVSEAFALLRHHARTHNLRLSELARSVIDQEPQATALFEGPTR